MASEGVGNGAMICLEWRDCCVLHRSMRVVRLRVGGGRVAGDCKLDGLGAGLMSEGWLLQPREDLVGVGGGEGGGRGGGGGGEGYMGSTEVVEDLRVCAEGMRCTYDGSGVVHTILSSGCHDAQRWGVGGLGAGENVGEGVGMGVGEDGGERGAGCGGSKEVVSALNLFAASEGAGGWGGADGNEDDGKYPFHRDVAGM